MIQPTQAKPPRLAHEHTGCLPGSSSSLGSSGSHHPQSALCPEGSVAQSKLLHVKLEGSSGGRSPDAVAGTHRACPISTPTAESPVNLQGPLAQQSQTADVVPLRVRGLELLASLSSQVIPDHSVPFTSHTAAQSHGAITACVANGPEEVKATLSGTGTTFQTEAEPADSSHTTSCEVFQQPAVHPVNGWQGLEINSLPGTQIVLVTQLQTRDSAELSNAVNPSQTAPPDGCFNLVEHGRHLETTSGGNTGSSAEGTGSPASVHNSDMTQQASQVNVGTVDHDKAHHCSLEVQHEHAAVESSTSNQPSTDCSSTLVPHLDIAPAAGYGMDHHTNVHARSGVSSSRVSSQHLSPAKAVEIQSQCVSCEEMVNQTLQCVHDGTHRDVACMTDSVGGNFSKSQIGSPQDSLPGSCVISTVSHLHTPGSDSTAPTPARGTEPAPVPSARRSSTCVSNASKLSFGNSCERRNPLCTPTCVHTPHDLRSNSHASCAPAYNHQRNYDHGCHRQWQDQQVCGSSVALALCMCFAGTVHA